MAKAYNSKFSGVEIDDLLEKAGKSLLTEEMNLNQDEKKIARSNIDAEKTGTAKSLIDEHDINDQAHLDIRELIKNISIQGGTGGGEPSGAVKYVTLTPIDGTIIEGEDSLIYAATSDMSGTEIENYVAEGYAVFVFDPVFRCTLPLTVVDDGDCVFSASNVMEEFNINILVSDSGADVNITRVQTAMPNPHALTINGVIYDGSKEVDVEIIGKAPVVTLETEHVSYGNEHIPNHTLKVTQPDGTNETVSWSGGRKGADGGYFLPNVSNSGDLSWEYKNDSSPILTPATQNIKGIGIKNIALKSQADTGNTYTITLTDGSSYDFVAPAGPKGSDATSAPVELDATLTKFGMAADAGAVGFINILKEQEWDTTYQEIARKNIEAARVPLIFIIQQINETEVSACVLTNEEETYPATGQDISEMYLNMERVSVVLFSDIDGAMKQLILCGGNEDGMSFFTIDPTEKQATMVYIPVDNSVGRMVVLPLVGNADDAESIELDATLTKSGMAADAGAVGTRLNEVLSQAVKIDTTLTTSGKAADAKVVGTKLQEIKEPVDRMLMQMGVSPVLYGSNGTVTKDTAAFQAALAENRRVHVPGGEYHINAELIVRDNCELTLSQDTVLVFENTSGNCITLNRSASLQGNHATIKVPYAFTGNVINADTSVHTAVNDVPPFTKWDPQWKTARYLTDLNIVKPASSGQNYSKEGNANGTAVYIEADGYATSPFIWGLNFSGLYIAGAFTYGVRAVTIVKPPETEKGSSSGYNNDMRIAAYIDSCDIGVSLEDCSNAYISAIVQPRNALNSTKDNPVVYARHGIQLIRSRNVDLSGSRVWDWNSVNSLWTPGNMYQHIAMVGNCSGAILSDFLYYEMPGYDIRDLIYTDTPSNLEKINILQEPFTRWFKPIDNEPYFFDSQAEKRLALKEELDAFITGEYVPTFTDALKTSINKDGTSFSESGYKIGYSWSTNGELVEKSAYVSTGLIKCSFGSVIRVKGMPISTGYNATSGAKDTTCRVLLFKSDFSKVSNVNQDALINNIQTSNCANYKETDDEFEFSIENPAVQYVAITVRVSTLAPKPYIAINEYFGFRQEGYLSDGVYVKSENVEGLAKKTTSVSSASTDDQYPTAKAVYSALSSALGEYVADIASIIGGDA